ncbi:MAG: hypothetical protein ACSLE6_06530 [Mycobacterium sp.]
MVTDFGAVGTYTRHNPAPADTHPIEIKVNFEVGVTEALAALGRPRPVATRRIWFIVSEDDPLQLLSRHIILRVNSGTDGDGSTTRLRPIDPDDLVGEWARRFTTATTSYRIEGDWSGPRRTTGASLKFSHPRGTLIEALESGNSQSMFTAAQRKLLRECTRTDVEKLRLVALGPVESSKWRNLWRGTTGAVDAERWTVPGLDVLELSIRLTAGPNESGADLQRRAGKAQRGLASDAARHALQQVSDVAESKTERVLGMLAAAEHTAPTGPGPAMQG